MVVLAISAVPDVETFCPLLVVLTTVVPAGIKTPGLLELIIIPANKPEGGVKVLVTLMLMLLPAVYVAAAPMYTAVTSFILKSALLLHNTL